MCSEGSGRLLLLWFNSGYPTFEDFCLGEPAKTRELRRVFLLASAWCFRRHVKYLNSEQFQLTLCGDSNADTGTMDQFFQTWDRKKHCCVSSGICKEMKKMGVTSNDLKTRKWRQTMYHTAATLQLSMADVEAMHSRNRVLARSAFHSIASKFINKECKSFYEEAQVLQGCKSSETSCLNQDFKKDGLQVISQKPYQKGQSALELFRHRYLKGKMANESFNPCSKEVWNEVKDSYNSLPQDQKDIYESMSSESKAHAALQRAKKKAEKTGNAQRDETANNVALVDEQKEPPFFHVQSVPYSKLTSAVSDASTLEDVVQLAGKKLRQELPGKHTFPLSENVLETAFQGLARNGLSGKAAEAKFRVESERMARPPDNDIFPERVVHQGVCGELCRNFTDPRRISFHQRVEDLFHQLVRDLGGVKEAVGYDPLCHSTSLFNFYFYIILYYHYVVS